MYQYRLYACRYGGEYVSGFIPTAVAEYWQQQGSERMQNYLCSFQCERDQIEKETPEEFRLPEWWEIDEIAHLNCALMGSSMLVVENSENGEIVYEKDMEHNEITTRTMVPLQTLLKDEKEGHSVFHGFSSEKGIWEYGELQLEEPFSIEKLELFGEVHIAECFLVGLSYDGQELEQGESGGVGKGFSCWFD
jgi:hypothetical protein